MYWRESKPPTQKSNKELLAPALPTLLWLVGAAIALLAFHGPIERLLDRATRVKVAGLEVEAAVKVIAQSVERLRSIPERAARPVSPTDPLRASLVRRWAEMRMSERPLRVLLLHDRIATARSLREPFQSLGFTADIGICPAEAESLLRRHAYDVVISDIDWSSCPQVVGAPASGTAFLVHAESLGIAQPTVFYIAKLKPERGTPPYASGISDNWYEVLHFVLDIIARRE